MTTATMILRRLRVRDGRMFGAGLAPGGAMTSGGAAGVAGLVGMVDTSAAAGAPVIRRMPAGPSVSGVLAGVAGASLGITCGGCVAFMRTVGICSIGGAVCRAVSSSATASCDEGTDSAGPAVGVLTVSNCSKNVLRARSSCSSGCPISPTYALPAQQRSLAQRLRWRVPRPVCRVLRSRRVLPAKVTSLGG